VIRVDSITIQEFRGIRDLTLNFKGNNFAICGPNGTGKSGIVDALEFGLTGKVSRLSGEGSGQISLKQHGPHVDQRDPEKARVVLNLTIPSLKKTVTLERNLKTPSIPLVTPDDADVVEVLKHVEAHPEFVLSRRELILYVLATPGNRADEVQALLHLDRIEQARLGLQKIANNCEKQSTGLDTTAKQARDRFLNTLNISRLSKDEVLAATNVQRAILGLPPLADMTGTTSLKDGLATPGLAQPQRIPKAHALADIKVAREALDEISSVAIASLADEIKSDLTELADDPAVAAIVKREGFYATGLELIDAEACPLCDTAWNIGTLRKHIQAKLDHLEELSRKRKAEEIKIAPLIVNLRKVQSAMIVLCGYAKLAKPPLLMRAASDYSATCGAAAEQLATFLPLTDSISVLANLPILPEGVVDAVDGFEKTVVALPEPTKEDAARDWLTVAQERLDVWRDAMRKQMVGRAQAQTAREVSNIYAATSDGVLATIYADVEKDFASLYAFVNHDDEEKFTAHLVPSIGKLGFDVDFYGRGWFPPGAYHSEGHQDSMGLCLYLALMRHLQGSEFTLAVLDDVLMSVDVGHRREVCTLLKKEFPKTQFIMTTHDQIWLRHMRTEHLIGGHVRFTSWSVDHGPTHWDGQDVWKEIDDHLQKDDVRSAAGLLRHYLEYTSAELCYRLHALVGLRGDDRYQLGELLPAAISCMNKLYKKANRAANSWNQQDVVQHLASRASEFGRLAAASNAENWQVNVAVHFNSWDNLVKEDFVPVVQAIRDLLGGFTCPDCHEYVRVSPDRETAESVRCGCGNTNINLREKE
jgi:ABC-type Mn2+/Zn2+ transport system ATPase subunit